MTQCSLLEGKTKEESLTICLNCSLPTCILDSAKHYQINSCPHCGGRLYWDEEEEEWCCFNCARRDLLDTGQQTKEATKLAMPTPNAQPEPTIVPASTPPIPTLKRQDKRPSASSPRPVYSPSSNRTWFAPHEITFHHRQMPFLLANLELLREGHYPPNPQETGYFDPKLPRIDRKHPRGKRSYFETASTLAAEVDARLEQAGLDGLMLEYLYATESENKLWLIAHLANMLKTDISRLQRRIHGALRFISGWKRKTQIYTQYRAHRKYRMKNREND